MPVGILQMLNGTTQEQYDSINEKMFGTSRPSADQAPDGLVVHSAGPTENGWYIYDIWESREAFQRFTEERVMPAVRELIGDVPPPPGSEPQFFEVASLTVAK